MNTTGSIAAATQSQTILARCLSCTRQYHPSSLGPRSAGFCSHACLDLSSMLARGEYVTVYQGSRVVFEIEVRELPLSLDYPEPRFVAWARVEGGLSERACRVLGLWDGKYAGAGATPAIAIRDLITEIEEKA